MGNMVKRKTAKEREKNKRFRYDSLSASSILLPPSQREKESASIKS